MYIYLRQDPQIDERRGERPVTLLPSRRYNFQDLTPSGALGGGFGETLGCVDLKNSPPDYTIYSPIDLGIGFAGSRSGKSVCVQPITGIFVPKNYKMKPVVDLIVYFHGFTDELPGDGTSIMRYWDGTKFPFFALREGVNASGKNVVLVAPTLGPKSQAGRLVKAGGFDAYLNEVVAALNLHARSSTSKPVNITDIANIILACHSGGGSPMLQIATGNDNLVAKVRECWGFDSLNSGRAANGAKLFTQPDGWLKWARTTSSKLFIFFKGSTKAESQYLDGKVTKAGLTNIIKVTPSSATTKPGVDAGVHFWVPLAHWRDSIKAAPFLSNR